MYDPRATAANLETYVKSGFGEEAESVELDCLAVATCFDKTNDEHKEHARIAKKAIKKHASAPVLAALSRITRRNYFPKIDPNHRTTRSVFRKLVERLDDFDDLADILDFDHIGFAARLVALSPGLLVYLLARRDLTFFADYFAYGHPRDTIEFTELDHPDNGEFSHVFSLDEVAALARISRFTHLEIRTDEDAYPLPDDLSAWENLTYLRVRARKVRAITQANVDALGELPELTHLVLGTLLSNLPDDLSPLRRLTALDLSSNRLKELPDSIASLEHLKELDLRANPITALPDTFGSLSSLESLDLRRLPLSSCSPGLAELSNLRKLEVSSHRDSTELFAALPSLTNLRHLSITSVEDVETLPDGLGDLTNLEFLAIERLPNLKSGFVGLGNLTKLRVLRLDHLGSCGVASMLDEIGTLTNLEYLHVKETDLSGTFPDQLVHCHALRDLSLEKSHAAAPTIDFSNFPDLEWLDLRGTKIESYPKGLFTLSRLERLFLGGAEGSAPNLPEEVRGLASLEWLELEHAGITALPSSFTELSELCCVNLSFNEGLEGLPDGMENLTKLHDFSVFYCTSPDLARDVAALRPKMPWCFIH